VELFFGENTLEEKVINKDEGKPVDANVANIHGKKEDVFTDASNINIVEDNTFTYAQKEFENKKEEQNEKNKNGNVSEKGKEKFIVDGTAFSAKRTQIINILKQLKAEIDQRKIYDVPRFRDAVLPEGFVFLHDFALPIFDEREEYGKVIHKLFASVSVSNDKVRFYSYIGYLDEDTRELDVDGPKEKEDIFDEISLEDEECIEKVKHLADKINKINSLFLSLYDICESFKAGKHFDNEGAVITFDFCKNKFRRFCFAESENNHLKCYLSKINLDGLKIKIFYRAINGKDIKELEYNIVKDDDLQALTKIFSEGSVENIEYEEENMRVSEDVLK